MEKLANISSFESLGTSGGGSSVFNAIDLTKTPRIDLTKKPQVNLSKDNLRPYFGMIADGIGSLIGAGVTPNSVLRFCQQRISQYASPVNQQKVQQMGQNMASSMMNLFRQHARGIPVQGF